MQLVPLVFDARRRGAGGDRPVLEGAAWRVATRVVEHGRRERAHAGRAAVRREGERYCGWRGRATAFVTRDDVSRRIQDSSSFEEVATAARGRRELLINKLDRVWSASSEISTALNA